MEYQCGKCKHYMIQSEFAGVCMNPGCSFFCTHVGITSTCSKWEAENTALEYRPPTKAESLCSRCFHRNACNSILKEHLLIRELVYGKTPICRDFVEIVLCRDCTFCTDRKTYLRCTRMGFNNGFEVKPDDFCSRGERDGRN